MDENQRFRTALAATLRAEKAARGLTDADLATAADVHTNTIASYMNGKADMKTATLRAIAAMFGLTAGELMDRAEARMEDL